MSMRNAGAQPLAFLCAPAFARHVGRGPGLVDEDEPFRIEIELALEPGFAPRLYVRAVLLARMGGLFLNVRPQRSRNVHSVARLAFTPRSASSRSRSSLIVKSGVASINPEQDSRDADRACERRGCPCLRAVRSPVSRARRTQTIAVASPTPKRLPPPGEPAHPPTRRQSRDHANPGCRPSPSVASIAIAMKESCSRRFGNPEQNRKTTNPL